MVHSTSAPAKLDRMAASQDKASTENPRKVSQDQVIIGTSSCSANKFDMGDVQGGEVAQYSFSDECSSVKTETNHDKHETAFSKTADGQENIGERDAKDKNSNEYEDFSLAKHGENSETLSDKGNEQETSFRKENSEQDELSIDADQHESNTEVDVSKEPNQGQTNRKSLMSRLVEGSKKLSSANSSPKARRKQENSDRTCDELPKEAETSLGLTANFKKNFKNRFADVSISFRKNDDAVNASELQWQTEDSEDTQEPARTDGKRNFLAAAQERGRTFIPDLKSKLSGLSNRSPRLERRRAWEKFIRDSECRTRIIQI